MIGLRSMRKARRLGAGPGLKASRGSQIGPVGTLTRERSEEKEKLRREAVPA